MKIAYCIPGLHNPSGMERVLTVKANYLVSKGYEIHIILTDGANKPAAFPLNPNVQVHQLDVDFEEPYSYPFIRRVLLYKYRMRIFKKRLNRCLCQIRPDITVSLLRRDINFINQMTDGSLKVGEFHFTKTSYRNFTPPSWLPRYVHAYIERKWMDKLIKDLKQLTRFVVLTHEDARKWTELQNVVVIPNPVSFMPEEISTCTNKQVIAAGRYVWQKGFDRLIPAWKLVAEKHPDWKLKIYGDGSMREQLESQIDELDLTDSCILEHTSPRLADALTESSIFALSSRFEGFGLVIIEAMTCGIPVVSFTCPCGPRDIITDETDGFLVEEDDISGMAAKINQLIEDDELRQRMGKNARLKAEKYSIENVGKMWINLFESLHTSTDSYS